MTFHEAVPIAGRQCLWDSKATTGCEEHRQLGEWKSHRDSTLETGLMCVCEDRAQEVTRVSVVAHTFDLSAQEAEAGQSPALHSVF